MAQPIDQLPGQEKRPALLLHHQISGVNRLCFARPILSRALLGELRETLLRLRAGACPIVLCSSHATIFLAGADLAEVAAIGRESSAAYAHHVRRCLAPLSTYPAPVVAAVAGSCTGGGLDLVLSCDAIVASAEARFSHPGASRGLVTCLGGTALLPHTLGPAAARAAMLRGQQLAAADLGQGTRVLEVAGDTEAAATAEALRLTTIHPSRLTTWRQLRRGRFVDRFRTVVVHNEGREESVTSVIRRS